MIVTSRSFVVASTIVILILSAILTYVISKTYMKTKRTHLFYWSAGLFVFTVSVLLETLMASGIYNVFIISLYLFLVAVLVNFLSLGSFALYNNKKFENYYYIYSGITVIFLIITLALYPPGYLISDYIVYGPLPLPVTISSSFVTFPAAFFIVLIAIISYKKNKNKKLLSIIAGVIIVSIAGTLYIARFPVFLYYAEFIGIVLLWIGFV
ncbi:hypothetical protein [Picrophilus oshimae]|uniref:Hypothetical membrane protein n=1 Tax=Picrophilus torridus (strain ATCC 700027 / DSM 9790 / JCM 10055 / NBRC 100828 / KAW 2/3) TaxID=1122961 RepID=Q6L0T5_PICTO|nr:hypothetical protein [Picrophilus oshimae]AAT43417.1 hypothetical membrane protein [Picrophilus oshimae DSM 9789]SMD30272.1 hypothetical protein SAMN02745355_0143 [Picrophilus oshimae DSM 9789]